jgi:hypothetical protein
MADDSVAAPSVFGSSPGPRYMPTENPGQQRQSRAGSAVLERAARCRWRACLGGALIADGVPGEVLLG